MKNNWRKYLILSVAITGAGTLLACIILMEYNLLLTNQLTIIHKVLLSLLGIASGIVAGIFNIQSIKQLLKSTATITKYLKLIFINFPLLIFQVFVLFAVLLIVGYD